MNTVKLPVIVRPGEDGYFVAEVPVIPGCVTQGATVKEALDNLREAAALCLENQDLEGWQLPASYCIEEIEVSA